MDKYTVTAHEWRHLFTAEDEPLGVDYAFVKMLLGDLSRQFVAGNLIVVPDLNGVKADDIVRALDIIYPALARLCVDRSE
jgi:hypothetical protein